jgi:hypothetical protein
VLKGCDKLKTVRKRLCADRASVRPSDIFPKGTGFHSELAAYKKRHMIWIFSKKNTSKIPVDNTYSLNIPITKIINALTIITIIKTSVLLV